MTLKEFKDKGRDKFENCINPDEVSHLRFFSFRRTFVFLVRVDCFWMEFDAQGNNRILEKKSGMRTGTEVKG